MNTHVRSSIQQPLLFQNGGASYIAGSNWPLRGAKSTLWEGGTRVPAFVYSKTLLKKTGVATNE